MDKNIKIKILKNLYIIKINEWKKLYTQITNCDNDSIYSDLCFIESTLLKELLALRNDINDLL